MLPLRDHTPSQTRPLITLALIAVSIAVFLASWLQPGNDFSLPEIYARYAMIPTRIWSGQGYYTLFTSMFLPVGFLHVAVNMLFLWVFGDNLGDELGHVQFLLFYLAAGIAAGLVQVLASPYSPFPTVRASGAIAGVMGAYVLLYPRARVDILFIFLIFFLGIFGSGLGHAGPVVRLSTVQRHRRRHQQWRRRILGPCGWIRGWFRAHAAGWLGRGGLAFWRANSGQPPPQTERSQIPSVRRRRR